MSVLMFNNILYLLSNALSVYSKYNAMYIYFDKSKIRKSNEIFLHIGYFLINSILFLLFENPIINMSNNVIIYFLLTFIYISPVSKKLIATITVYAVSMPIESLVYYFMRSLSKAEYINTATIMVSSILFYFCVILFKNFKNIKANNKISLSYVVMIFLTVALSIYISASLILLYNHVEENFINIILCIASLLIINVVSIYVYNLLNKKHEEELEKKLLEQQNNFYEKQLKIMSNSQDYVRSVKHDLRNHFISLKSISRNADKVDEFIYEFLEHIDDLPEYAKSGNSVFDSILNYKLHEAKKKGIEFELDLKIPYELSIKTYDISAILGNLLDNAIEAASNIDTNKQIKINIYFEKNNLFINILNTFDGKIIRHKERYMTRKNKAEHGLGILSVKKALEKYNGEIYTFSENNLFSAHVILYIT